MSRIFFTVYKKIEYHKSEPKVLSHLLLRASRCETPLDLLLPSTLISQVGPESDTYSINNKYTTIQKTFYLYFYFCVLMNLFLLKQWNNNYIVTKSIQMKRVYLFLNRHIDFAVFNFNLSRKSQIKYVNVCRNTI